MLYKTRFSKSSLRHAPRSCLNSTLVSSTRRVLIPHTTSGLSSYSTSIPSTPSASESNETPLTALPPLPDQSEWRTIFNPPGSSLWMRERVSLRNPQTARILAEGFTKWTKPLLKAGEAEGKGRVAKGAPKIIIEAFPGTPPAFAFLISASMCSSLPRRGSSRSWSFDESLAYTSKRQLR